MVWNESIWKCGTHKTAMSVDWEWHIRIHETWYNEPFQPCSKDTKHDICEDSICNAEKCSIVIQPNRLFGFTDYYKYKMEIVCCSSENIHLPYLFHYEFPQKTKYHLSSFQSKALIWCLIPFRSWPWSGNIPKESPAFCLYLPFFLQKSQSPVLLFSFM